MGARATTVLSSAEGDCQVAFPMSLRLPLSVSL